MPNIERRKHTWYATLHVPSDVRSEIGKAKFFQTLGTTDKRKAEQRAAPIVAGWKAEIERARGNTDPFIAQALGLLREISTEDDPFTAEAKELYLSDYAEELEKAHGPEKAQAFVSLATGASTPMASILPEWRAQLTHAPKTIDQMGKDVERFASKFISVQAVNRQSVREWFQALASEPSNLSPSSIKRIAGFCRNFWRYLQETGAAPDGESPIVTPTFAKQRKGTAGRGSGWTPFAPAEVIALHSKAVENDDQELADLIMLGAYTGARIEELCSLKLDHVTSDSFNILESKTEAGIRVVPIHSKLQDVVSRLRVTRPVNDTDGYLLAGLTFNKYRDRSNAIGKRFGRMKASMGFSGKQVFHSIRKTVVTLLENAGVGENVTADIVGHDKPRITYGLYSGGATPEVMREALERIAYPSPVEQSR